MPTEADMELLRRIYGEWAQGRFWDVSYYDPEIEFVLGADLPDPGTYTGLTGLEAGFRNWLESWRTLRFELEELYPAGESILAAFHMTGVGKASGAETDVHGAHVWTMRDGRAVRIEVYMNRPEAFEAAGLQDPNPPA